MSDSRAELAETFRTFSDEYLVERLQSGDLTALAQSVAQDELRQRGVAAIASQPPSAEAEEPRDTQPVRFVTVARFMMPTEAHIVRGRLEAEGIPAFVVDGNLVQVNTLLSIAVGGVRVQVPASLASDALEIIGAIRAGGLGVDDNAWREPLDP